MKKNVILIITFSLVILLVPMLALRNRLEEEPKYNPNTIVQVKMEESGDVKGMTVSDYIKGVVAAEMPANFHVEALKAQAVAVHTYALRNISSQLTSPEASFDEALLSTDSTKFMAYSSKEQLQEKFGDNFDAYYKKISDAVDEVFYDVLTYEDQPIAAAFHSMSAGVTEDAVNIWGSSVSYLQPVDSQGDLNAPNYETTASISIEDVREKLTASIDGLELPEDPLKWFVINSTTSSGTVTDITVGNQNVSGTDVRAALGLRSAAFTVTCSDGSFTFITKGYGHGVGMSQYGANYLAEQGYTYDQILLHYYSGVTITTLPA